jgi:hypothetical protein
MILNHPRQVASFSGGSGITGSADLYFFFFFNAIFLFLSLGCRIGCVAAAPIPLGNHTSSALRLSHLSTASQLSLLGQQAGHWQSNPKYSLRSSLGP